MNKIGFFDRTVEQLESPRDQFACNPQATGKNGGHNINLRLLAKDGVILLGRLKWGRDTRLEIAPNLHENLAKADEFSAKVVRAVDEYIQKGGVNAPEQSSSGANEVQAGPEMQEYRELDLTAEGISTIIWAIGFRPDHSWIDIPVFDDQGYAAHRRGVTTWPGLYFLGLHFQHRAKSDLLFGVGEDAEYVADHIEAGS